MFDPYTPYSSNVGSQCLPKLESTLCRKTEFVLEDILNDDINFDLMKDNSNFHSTLKKG